MAQYTTEAGPLADIATLARDWQALQATADASYFQSWGWIGSWLVEVAEPLQPRVLRVHCDGELVGLGIFVNRDIRRRGLFRARALYLNEYPFDGRNMVIEYNGLLCAPGHERAVYRQAVDTLLTPGSGIEELHLGALQEKPDLDCLQQAVAPPKCLQLEDTSVAWQVDLAMLQPGVDGFLSTLSKNRRAQLRRSLRHFESGGALTLSVAGDLEEALQYLAQLEDLHTRHRRTRGESGAFANPHWVRFHRRLINNRFDTGEIQLIRVRNEQQAVGYLYNLLWRGRVYVMQTGFAEVTDRREMPGYVVHALAIAYNRDLGMALYDLMHGDDLYKQILCNRSSRLCWAVVQEPRLKFRVENLVVTAVRRARHCCRR